ncbi:unnamed protein product [Adineta steineri]|uniref:Uncharacterized protein n=1 Tax=Adineta steineri TaxID=433720 RepID=A0A813TFV1_9BILA|nr:unnamed protein product [Adineta steineri]CAF0819551.1 unnamed protein product [Adineta steineri]
MMKFIICFCFVALVTVNAVPFELSDAALEYLANVKLADLPESIRSSLTTLKGRNGDNSHWCCINEQPITTVTATKIEYGTKIVHTKTKVGYVSCGFMGSMRCSHFVAATRAEIYSYIQTFQIPNMNACASHEVKCCSGYLLVAENCHSFTELVAQQELIQFLSQLGLLGIGK